jgi:hypothetical protein
MIVSVGDQQRISWCEECIVRSVAELLKSGILDFRILRVGTVASRCASPADFWYGRALLVLELAVLVCYAFHPGWVALLLGAFLWYFLLGGVLAVPALVITPPRLEKNFHVSRTLDL